MAEDVTPNEFAHKKPDLVKLPDYRQAKPQDLTPQESIISTSLLAAGITEVNNIGFAAALHQALENHCVADTPEGPVHYLDVTELMGTRLEPNSPALQRLPLAEVIAKSRQNIKDSTYKGNAVLTAIGDIWENIDKKVSPPPKTIQQSKSQAEVLAAVFTNAVGGSEFIFAKQGLLENSQFPLGSQIDDLTRGLLDSVGSGSHEINRDMAVHKGEKLILAIRQPKTLPNT